jgi:hypothetical protein
VTWIAFAVENVLGFRSSSSTARFPSLGMNPLDTSMLSTTKAKKEEELRRLITSIQTKQFRTATEKRDERRENGRERRVGGARAKAAGE